MREAKATLPSRHQSMNAKLRRVATEVLWHFSEVVRPTDDVRSRDDTVAKVFSGQRTKIIKTADAFRRRRREGPHRFAQKRPRSFISALRSIAVAESAKDQLLRDFRRRSIFDFCNTIPHVSALRTPGFDKLAVRSAARAGHARHSSHCHTERSDLKVARTSDTKSAGCSQAAKCVPLGWLL